ncbi:MAG: hypothetical protein OXI59_19145 [Gemmatimonadota bacterium]|nr:hypothetical protein [Gemmatimonadota bacterium]
MVIPATGTSTVDVVVSGPGPAGVKYYQSGGTELAVRTADVNTLYPSVGLYETPISTLFEGGAGGPDHLHISATSSDTSVATATVIADTDGILRLIVNVLTTGTSTLTVDAFDALGNTAKYTGNLAIT